MKAVSMDEVTAETAAYYDLEEQDSIGFRCTAAGREIAAYLCHRWTGETESATLVPKGQAFVVDSHQMQNRRVKVVNVHAIANDVVSKLIRFPIGDSRLDATAGHPGRKATRVMVISHLHKNFADRLSSDERTSLLKWQAFRPVTLNDVFVERLDLLQDSILCASALSMPHGGSWKQTRRFPRLPTSAESTTTRTSVAVFARSCNCHPVTTVRDKNVLEVSMTTETPRPIQSFAKHSLAPALNTVNRYSNLLP